MIKCKTIYKSESVSKKELRGIPVIANVNFGHVQPYATIPIGGKAVIEAQGFESEIWIEQN